MHWLHTKPAAPLPRQEMDWEGSQWGVVEQHHGHQHCQTVPCTVLGVVKPRSHWWHTGLLTLISELVALP